VKKTRLRSHGVGRVNDQRSIYIPMHHRARHRRSRATWQHGICHGLASSAEQAAKVKAGQAFKAEQSAPQEVVRDLEEAATGDGTDAAVAERTRHRKTRPFRRRKGTPCVPYGVRMSEIFSLPASLGANARHQEEVACAAQTATVASSSRVAVSSRCLRCAWLQPARGNSHVAASSPVMYRRLPRKAGHPRSHLRFKRQQQRRSHRLG
jgi:hypothetical protein